MEAWNEAKSRPIWVMFSASTSRYVLAHYVYHYSHEHSRRLQLRATLHVQPQVVVPSHVQAVPGSWAWDDMTTSGMKL